MTKKSYLFVHVLSFFYTMFAYSFFSIKDVSSWVFGYKQETLHKEIPCTQQDTLVIKNITGSLSIKGWSLPKITLQAHKSSREKDLDHITINSIVEQQTITIKTEFADKKIKGDIDFYIMVPHSMNLKLTTDNGTIKTKGIQGIIEAKTAAGEIIIQDAENNLFLKNNYGPIMVTMKKITPWLNIILEASGFIGLGLPKNTDADIDAKAANTITSDHYLTLKPRTIKLNNHAWTSLKKEVHGTIGKGGATISIRSTHGSIKITEN